ncbi:ArnT family glycosyltransferase [Alteromonas sp. CYL-A6]|uniref:ArnT family glycosyltransferase n=1 Tax=Alteromonas nitratireducens TaxID=3390813 RepID=UPI0034BD2469
MIVFLNALTERQQFIALMVISAVLILAGLGLRDPWPADEPRFALIAKDMIDSGQWFFPSRGGELYPDKPPVFMWSIALFYALTGSITVAFLIPSALAGLATVYLTYRAGSMLWDRQTGLLSGFLLLFCFQFLLQAKSAQIDALVCAFITLGCYSLLRFLLYDGQWRWYLLAWVAMGLGVITKGVGFLPLLMLIPYVIARWSGAHHLAPIQREHWLKWASGPVVMLAAIGCWLIPMLLIVAGSDDTALAAYRDNILFRQTVTRYADSWHHIKPFWYFVVSVIPAFWLPLTLLLPWLIPQWVRAFRQQDARIILTLSWVLLVILFFSMSPGKRGVYIFPALPILCVAAGPYLRQVFSKPLPSWLIWGLTTLLAVALLGLGIAGELGVKAAVKLQAKYEISPWAFFMTVGVWGIVVVIANARRQRWLSWPAFLAGLWVLYSTWGYSLLEDVKTPKPVFDTMAAFVPDDAQLGLVDFSEQFILFSPYPVTHFGYHTPTEDQLKAAYQWLGEKPHRYILLDKSHISGDCFMPDKAIDAGYAHRTHWVLLGRETRTEQCERPASDVHTYTTIKRQ